MVHVKFNVLCQESQTKTARTSSSAASLHKLPAYICAVAPSPTTTQALHHSQKQPATVTSSLVVAATQSCICKPWRPRPSKSIVPGQWSSPETPHAGRNPLSCWRSSASPGACFLWRASRSSVTTARLGSCGCCRERRRLSTPSRKSSRRCHMPPRSRRSSRRAS